MTWITVLCFGVQFLGFHIYGVDGVKCFECSHYPSPAYCTDTTTCRDDQDCYVEEMVTTGGRVIYNSGCISVDQCAAISRKRNTDITTCKTCCHGDLCNNEGCSKQAIPRDQRGPYCYTCDLMTKPDECDKLSICATDQQCLLHIPHEYQSYPVPLYRAECEQTDACRSLTNIPSECSICCNTDFCNDHCANNSVPAPVGSVANVVLVSTTTQASVSSKSKPVTSTIKVTTSTLKPTTSTTISTTSTTETTTRDFTQSITKQRITTDSNHCVAPYDVVPNTLLCIWPVYQSKTWSNAKHYCKNNGGDLLFYRTDDQRTAVFNYLKSQLPHKHENEFWVGLQVVHQQHNDDRRFQPTTRDDFNDTTSIAIEKRDSESQQCMRARYDHEMRATGKGCDNHLQFICQSSVIH